MKEEICEAVQDPEKDTSQEKEKKEISLFGRTIDQADLFKFLGLLAFFALVFLACVLAWPKFHGLFEQGGLRLVIHEVKNAGPMGFVILFGMQFVQMVVAFIPGEVIQVAAGALYGPWLGTVLILLGCVLSGAFIFTLVHKLGAPFVQSMVSTENLERFRRFDESGKLNIVVFILFLIPGLPKDTFTYLIPLTNMRMKTFLILSNVARIPGVFVSCYAANSLMEGRVFESVALFLLGAVLAIAGVLLKDPILNMVDKLRAKMGRS